MRRLGFDKLIDARHSRERDLVVAMVAERILAPEASKLGMTRAWADTTLGEDLGVADAHEDELYAAMDWLIERQEAIEKRLAKRHLKNGGLVLFDLTSSYFEGVTCPLAKIGYSRDGKPGTLQVNYGLLTDARGCPVSVSVFEGNTGDPKTLLPQVEKVRPSFGLDRLVMAGDRGMISNIQIEAMRKLDGVDWITALKSGAIAKLAEGGHLQLDLFDERNLISLTHEDYPGERLIACRNPSAGQAARREAPGPDRGHDARARQGCGDGGRRPAQGRRQDRRPGRQGGRQVQGRQALRSRHRGCLVHLQGQRGARRGRSGARRALRDPHQRGRGRHGAEQAVLNYKRLAEVERAFRTLKGVDLKCARSATAWRRASRPTSSSACWPITCSGT